MGFSRVTFFFLSCFLLTCAFTDPSYKEQERIVITPKMPLLNSYITGDKSLLSRDLRKAHEVLGISHWLTPSGIHLAILFFLVGIFLKNRKIKFYLSILICLLLFFFDSFSSIERMAWFYLFQCKLKNVRKSFYLSSVICLLNGNFYSSPISYFLSYTFLSIFIFSKHYSYSNFFRLYFLQMIVQLTFKGHFNPIGSAFNFLLTPLSAFIFPSLFLPGLEQLFSKTLIFLSSQDIISFKVTLSSLLIFVTIVFLLRIFKWNLYLVSLVISTLILWPKPIYNYDREKLAWGFSSPPPKEYIRLEHHKKRVISYHPFNIKCSNRFVGNGWSTHCKQN
tara:strand:- start:15411 stop:16415 length:1005 start_codon:yes stop_codon:yes gene_type:complete